MRSAEQLLASLRNSVHYITASVYLSTLLLFCLYFLNLWIALNEKNKNTEIMLLCFIAYVHVDHFVHLFFFSSILFSMQADERSNIIDMNERFLRPFWLLVFRSKWRLVLMREIIYVLLWLTLIRIRYFG